MARRTSFEHMSCSVAQTLEVVGDWWTLLIVRDVVLGVRRFEDLQRRLGIARNVLTDRLRRLVDHGVLRRRRYREHPPRDEYVLTPKGRDLVPVLHALREWGDRWVFGEGREPLRIVHEGCGPTRAVVSCSRCGTELRPGEVRVEAGPGASRDGDGSSAPGQA